MLDATAQSGLHYFTPTSPECSNIFILGFWVALNVTDALNEKHLIFFCCVGLGLWSSPLDLKIPPKYGGQRDRWSESEFYFDGR